jgi:peptidoglycan/LPS O-acetylase OafA/YrhL
MGAWWVYSRLSRPQAWILLASSVIVVGVNLFLERSGIADQPTIFGLGFAGVVSSAAALDLGKNSRLFVLIGNASYSIYLTHEAVEGLVMKVFMRLHVAALLGNEVYYILALSASVLAGIGAYLFVEKPLIRLLNRQRQDHMARSLARTTSERMEKF